MYFIMSNDTKVFGVTKYHFDGSIAPLWIYNGNLNHFLYYFNDLFWAPQLPNEWFYSKVRKNFLIFKRYQKSISWEFRYFVFIWMKINSISLKIKISEWESANTLQFDNVSNPWELVFPETNLVLLIKYVNRQSTKILSFKIDVLQRNRDIYVL